MRLGTWQLVADYRSYEEVVSAIERLDSDGGNTAIEIRLDGIKATPDHPRAHDIIGRCVNPRAFDCPEERH